MPFKYLSRWHRDAGSRVAQEIYRGTRACRELLLHGRKGTALAHGRTWLSYRQRDDWESRRVGR